MKPIKVFIMANGKGDRWTESLTRFGKRNTLPVHKQAVVVGKMPTLSVRQQRIAETVLKGQDGETIFHRTIRMLVEAGIDFDEIMVVGPRTLWRQYRADRKFKALAPEGEPGPIVNGLKTVSPLWESGKTIVLLGDVVYSYKALGQILDAQAPITFLGRQGQNPEVGTKGREMFGFSMTRDMYGIVLEHCANILANDGQGKLWDLFRSLDGTATLSEPHDYTDDLDSAEEYREFWLQLSQAALQDVPVTTGAQEQGV